MPMYLSRFSYTPETWARLIKNPEDRREAARSNLTESESRGCGGIRAGFGFVSVLVRDQGSARHARLDSRE